MRHRRGHLGNVPDLCGQVVRHRVDVLGEILPDAAHLLDLRLSAELPFGSNLTRHARHLARKGAELIDHRVDRVLQFENLTFHIDGNLP